MVVVLVLGMKNILTRSTNEKALVLRGLETVLGGEWLPASHVIFSRQFTLAPHIYLRGRKVSLCFCFYLLL